MTVAVLFTQIRRLHDLGQSGWWAVGLLVVQFVGTLVVMLATSTDVGLMVGLALTLVPVIVLGLIPGQPRTNSYGPPPGRPDLQETFS